MASEAEQQKIFIANFLNHSKNVIQMGFAWLFNHPEEAQTMCFEINRIRAMEQKQRQSPAENFRSQTLIRQAYIDYIIKLTRFGFKYVQNNRNEYDDVAVLQKIFRDYETLQRNCDKQKVVKNRHTPNCCGRQNDCHELPKPANPRFANIQARVDHGQQRKAQGRKPMQKASSSEDHAWQEAANQIHNLSKKIEKIQGNIQKVCEPPRCKKLTTEEELQNFMRKLDGRLLEIKNKKNRRMMREKFQSDLYADSDQDSSEYVISVNPLASHENPKICSKGKVQKRTEVGTVERHLVIPVNTSTQKNPKITPHYTLKKDGENGRVQVDLNLSFEKGIWHNNKLVDNIRIENVIPDPKFRNDGK